MKEQHKILFFANNTSLITNLVLKITPYFSNCEVLVLHNSKMQPNFKQIDLPIKNIDVSCLTYKEIKNILKEWSPDICILNNFRGIIDQFFIRICRAEKIKVVFLAHGILTEDVLTFKTLKKKNLLLRLKRVGYQFKQYFSFIIHSTSPLNELKILYTILFKNYFSVNPFDLYMVYGERCFNILKEKYELKKGINTYLVGYPLFSSECQKQKVLNSTHDNYNEGVLYVHQPFILDNYAQLSYEEEREFILKWANKLIPTYHSFTLLLHPRENLERYKLLYEGTKVNVIQSPNDFRMFINRNLVLGHYSTALLFSLYFNIPTYIIDYPSMSRSDLFKNIFPIATLDDFDKEKQWNNITNNKKYILGEENTFEHISNLILSII